MSQRTRQRSVFIVRQRPRPYPQTPQQERFKRASEVCGIRKGMNREELIKAMKECLPDYFKEQRGKPLDFVPSPSNQEIDNGNPS